MANKGTAERDEGQYGDEQRRRWIAWYVCGNPRGDKGLLEGGTLAKKKERGWCGTD